jgi:transposase-like protein
MEKKQQCLKYLALYAGGASLQQIAKRFDVAHPNTVRRAIMDHPFYDMVTEARKNAWRQPLTSEKLEATKLQANTAERLDRLLEGMSIEELRNWKAELQEEHGKSDPDRHSFQIEIDEDQKKITFRMDPDKALELSDQELRGIFSEGLEEVADQLERGYTLRPGIMWT